MEAGRGATILTLGILSVVLLGCIAGIPAWVMGSRDGRKIREGLMDAGERSKTQTGMVLGIIGTFISTLWIVAVVAAVGVAVFGVRVAH